MSQIMSQNNTDTQDIRFHCDPYTTIPNHCLEDTSLPLEARGLLVTMFSLRNDWHYSIAGLQKILPHSKDKIGRIIKILESHGYVRRESNRDAKGHFKYIYHIYGESQIYHDEFSGKKGNAYRNKPCPENKDTVKTTDNSENLPSPENRDTGKPSTENPNPENKAQLNTNKSTTNNKLLKSINQKEPREKQKKNDEIDMIEKKINLRFELNQKLGYERLLKEYPDNEKLIEIIFSVITDTLVHDEVNDIKISGYTYSYCEIENVLTGLDYDHLVYVINCISSRGKSMTNPIKYILQCLIQSKTKDIYDISQKAERKDRRFNSFNNFEMQNEYDYDELEKVLLDN